MPAGRLVSAAEGAHRDPIAGGNLSGASRLSRIRDRVRIEGTDSGRIRVVRATGSGTNCLRRARLFVASRNREQPIRNGHAIGDPLGEREVRGAELALDGKPGARVDGYQMLWVWT